jgi:hypothetical protein
MVVATPFGRYEAALRLAREQAGWVGHIESPFGVWNFAEIDVAGERFSAKFKMTMRGRALNASIDGLLEAGEIHGALDTFKYFPVPKIPYVARPASAPAQPGSAGQPGARA